jgi:hypothetical protein
MVGRNNEQVENTRKRKPDWSSVVGTGSMNINFNFWWTILFILLGIIFLPIYLFDYIKEKINE